MNKSTAVTLVVFYLCHARGVLASNKINIDSPRIAEVRETQNYSIAHNEYFEFYNLDKPIIGPPIQSGQTCNWTVEDEETVQESIKKIYNEFPGLIQAAAYKQKIVLVRVQKSSFIASANCNRIAFGDLFFKKMASSLRFRYLFHELVHVRDVGCTISYSPEWIEISLSKIKRISRLANLLTKNGRLELNKYLALHNIWPNIYACENLREALAEYISARTEEQDYHVNPNILMRVLKPTHLEAENRLTILNALNLTYSGSYELAIKTCMAGQSYGNDQPILNCLLAFNFAKLGKTYACIDACEKANKAFATLGIDSKEYWCHENLKLLGSTLLQQKQYSKALQAYSQLLINEPNDSEVLTNRARCYEALKLWSLSLKDKYRSLGYLSQSPELTSISEDSSLVQKVLKKFPRSPFTDKTQLRAKLLSMLADRTEDKKERLSILKNAIFEYKAVLESVENPDLLVLSKLAWLNLELTNLSEAREFTKRSLELQPTCIPAQIVEVACSELENDKQTAFAQFLAVKQKLSFMPENQHELQKNEFKILDLQGILDIDRNIE